MRTPDIWKPVPGEEGRYEVSNHGRARRVRTIVKVTPLTPVPTKHGYVRVGISGRLRTVHSLVAAAFIGERPPGYHVNHLNGDRRDNRVKNLEYTTPKGNQEHSWRRGRKPPHYGETTHFSKLTEQDVIQIRRLRAEGLSYSAIATNFNTKAANVWHICSGRTWKHLLNDHRSTQC